MNRIDKKFKALRKNKKKAFIAYITAGDPNLALTARLVDALAESGVDIVELGIPFSDPLADGPTIQAASQRALKKNANLSNIFKTVGRLRAKNDIPIAFMTYYNPVFKYGLEKFIKDCRKNGVDGVIIPDLPDEEAGDLLKVARKNRIAAIFLVAPTSTKARIKKITRDSTGFVYYVSLAGVTGARRDLPAEVMTKVRSVKSTTKKPVCVGFGISTADQARAIAKISDGVIVGSAIVKIIEKISNDKNLIAGVKRFAKKLSEAIHSA